VFPTIKAHRQHFLARPLNISVHRLWKKKRAHDVEYKMSLCPLDYDEFLTSGLVIGFNKCYESFLLKQ